MTSAGSIRHADGSAVGTSDARCDNGAVAQVADALDTARDAAARHAWRDAYASYSSVGALDLTPDDLERFAEAAWWAGRLDEAITLALDAVPTV